VKDLTAEQFMAIQSLRVNPMIEHWAIDGHSNGLLRVSVVSAPDVYVGDVDALLRKIFPDMEYRGSVGEDEKGDYYSIDVDGETLINLMIKDR